MNGEGHTAGLMHGGSNTSNRAVNNGFNWNMGVIRQVFAKLAQEVAKSPVQISFTHAMHVNLFFIHQLAQLTKVRVSFVFGNRLSLRDTETIDVVGEDATRQGVRDRLTRMAPPAIVVMSSRIAEKLLKT